MLEIYDTFMAAMGFEHTAAETKTPSAENLTACQDTQRSVHNSA